MRLLAVAVIYVLAGKLGLQFAFLHPSATPLWPCTGIALASVLLLGYRVWPALFAGAFVVNVTTAGSIATSLGIATGNTLEALVGGWLVTRYAGGRRSFDRASDVFAFAALAALAATTLSATIGVASLALGGYAARDAVGHIWLTWWLGDAAGALIVTPLALVWSRREPLSWMGAGRREALLLLLAVLVVGETVFGGLLPFGPRHYELSFVCMTPLLWAAFRFGQREVATAAAILATIAISGTLRGFGPFAADRTNESLMVLQAFMATMVVATMPVAAVVRESRRLAEAQERLRGAAEQQGARLQAVVEHMPAGVMIAEAPSGRLLLGNRQLERIWRHPVRASDSIEGYAGNRGFHRDGSPYAPAEWPLARSIATGEVVIGEQVDILREDGTRATLSMSAAPIRDDAGHVVAGVSIFQDVSEERRAEQMFRLAVEAAPNAMIMVDEQGRIVLANAQAEQLFGYTRDELRAQPVERLVPARFRAQHSQERQAFVREPRTRAMGTGRDLHALRHDGREVPVEIGLNPIRTDEGVFVLAAIVDITERKRAEEQRSRLLRRLAFLGDITRSVTSSLDLDTVLQRIVDGARELCGSDLAALLAREGETDVMRPRYRSGGLPSPTYEALRVERGWGVGGEVLRTRRPFRTADYPHDARVTPDVRRLTEETGLVALMVVPILIGEHVEGLLYAGNRSPRPFTDEDEEICVRLAGYAAIAIQNAQLFAREQAARTDAEAANRAKDQFLAVLSHELRTPLNVMMGWVRILRTDRLEERQRAHALEVIERNTRLQAQLINDLLDVSRIIAGKLELDRHPLDLVPVVQEAVDAIRAEAQAHGVALDVELDAATGEVLGDQLRLQQVVTNLLSNALKFTPGGGRIAVRLRRDGADVRLSVSDTGAGIDTAALPHIFKPFHQADSTTTRAHQGLGLGLAIVRQIVDRHGGIVQAESRGKDTGTVFTVRLPITAVRARPASWSAGPRERAVTGAVEAGARPLLEGRRVLVVDDQADARELVGLVLRQYGADVHLAASADEAVRVLTGGAVVDVLVSDLAMPGTDGYELIRTVRRLERQRGGQRVRAIALTAYAGPETRERALAAGFELHATKPLDPETLVELITKLL